MNKLIESFLLEAKRNILLEGIFDKMPQNFKKYVVDRQAGEKSKLVKISSGLSNKQKLASLLREEKSNYIAFLGKVNNSWAFMITVKDDGKKLYKFYVANDLIDALTQTYGKDSYKLANKANNDNTRTNTPVIWNDGQLGIKNYKYYPNRRFNKSGYFTEYNLSFDELFMMLPMGNDVDLYGISVDAERINKIKDRSQNKPIENTTEGISSETIKKYIKNKYFNTKVIDDLKTAFLKAGEGILNVDEPQELIKRINDLKQFADTLNKDISVLTSLSNDIDYYVGKDKNRKISDILKNRRILNLIKTGKVY